MSKQHFPNVEPLRKGYDGVIPITFDATFFDEMDMATGRLVAEFRESLQSSIVLFTADTNNDTMTRNGSTVVINVPGSATKTTKSPIVVFDFVRISGDSKRVIPGLWQWPVAGTVTRDVLA